MTDVYQLTGGNFHTQITILKKDPEKTEENV
jgi:hypothetical protein